MSWGVRMVANSCKLLSSEGVDSYEFDFHEEAGLVKHFFGFSSSQEPASP